MAKITAEMPQKWIYPSDVIGFGRCASCGSLWSVDLIENIFFKYCPRCGKRMDGKGEEHEKK